MYGYIYAIIVAILWGFSALLENHMVKQLDILFLYVVGGITFGISALFILIWKHATLIPMFKRATNSQLSLSILSAVGAIILSNFLFLMALEKTSKPSVVTALAYCAPVFTLIGAIVLLQYKVSKLELLGIVLTLAGVGIIAASVK